MTLRYKSGELIALGDLVTYSGVAARVVTLFTETTFETIVADDPEYWKGEFGRGVLVVGDDLGPLLLQEPESEEDLIKWDGIAEV